MLGGSDMIAAEMEEVVDLIVGGEEPLRLASRFELPHLPLSAARRLLRVFRSVVEPLVLAMLNAGHDLSLGRASLSVIMTRGGRICFFSSLRNNRLAACLSRRRWTRTSSTIPVWSTARHNQ